MPIPSFQPAIPVRSYWDGWDIDVTIQALEAINENSIDGDRRLAQELNVCACADGKGLFLWVDKVKWITKLEARYGTQFGRHKLWRLVPSIIYQPHDWNDAEKQHYHGLTMKQELLFTAYALDPLHNESKFFPIETTRVPPPVLGGIAVKELKNVGDNPCIDLFICHHNLGASRDWQVILGHKVDILHILHPQRNGSEVVPASAGDPTSSEPRSTSIDMASLQGFNESTPYAIYQRILSLCDHSSRVRDYDMNELVELSLTAEALRRNPHELQERKPLANAQGHEPPKLTPTKFIGFGNYNVNAATEELRRRAMSNNVFAAAEVNTASEPERRRAMANSFATAGQGSPTSMSQPRPLGSTYAMGESAQKSLNNAFAQSRASSVSPSYVSRPDPFTNLSQQRGQYSQDFNRLTGSPMGLHGGVQAPTGSVYHQTSTQIQSAQTLQAIRQQPSMSQEMLQGLKDQENRRRIAQGLRPLPLPSQQPASNNMTPYQQYQLRQLELQRQNAAMRAQAQMQMQQHLPQTIVPSQMRLPTQPSQQTSTANPYLKNSLLARNTRLNRPAHPSLAGQMAPATIPSQMFPPAPGITNRQPPSASNARYPLPAQQPQQQRHPIFRYQNIPPLTLPPSQSSVEPNLVYPQQLRLPQTLDQFNQARLQQQRQYQELQKGRVCHPSSPYYEHPLPPTYNPTQVMPPFSNHPRTQEEHVTAAEQPKPSDESPEKSSSELSSPKSPSDDPSDRNYGTHSKAKKRKVSGGSSKSKSNTKSKAKAKAKRVVSAPVSSGGVGSPAAKKGEGGARASSSQVQTQSRSERRMTRGSAKRKSNEEGGG